MKTRDGVVKRERSFHDQDLLAGAYMPIRRLGTSRRKSIIDTSGNEHERSAAGML